MKNLLRNITRFTPRKTFKQAVVFYLFYLITGVLFCFLLNAFLQLLFPSYFINGVLHEWWIMEQVVVCLALSIFIQQAKHMIGLYDGNTKNYLVYVFLTVLTIFLALFGGMLFGLLPVAYLTTFSKLQKSKSVLM